MFNRRKGSILGLVLGGVLVLAAVAVAANPHFIGGSTCTQTASNQINCSGKVAGLGNGPIYVVVTADAGCTNQDGSHVIPGHSTTVSGPFFATNGQFTFGGDSGNTVVGTGPSSCPGNNEPFISTTNVLLRVYECSSGSPTFNKKTGAQTNRNCTLAAQSTPTIV